MFIKVAFLLLTIPGFSLGASLACSKPGQCIDGTLITIMEAGTEKECLGNCKNTTDCQWYTYLQSPNECELFRDCDTVSTDNCPSCISGEVNCTINECGLNGICQGNMDHQETEITSELDCLNICKSYNYCKWYTYKSDTRICFIFEDCPTLNEVCSTCVTGEQGCSVPGSMKLMVTNGFDDTYQVTETEVIDLENPNNICDPLPDYPFGVDGATGVLLDGKTPIVCGGEFITYAQSNQCFKLDPDSRDWVEVASMIEAREEAASIALDNETIWITGGSDGNTFASTELAKPLVAASEPGPDLPFAVANHCLLKLSSSIAMLIGGTTSEATVTSSTLFIDITPTDGFGSSAYGPQLDIARGYHACGIVKDGSDGQVVVVAGGKVGPLGDSSYSTELWTDNAIDWVPGPNMPEGRMGAVGITSPDGKTFFVIGGYDVYSMAEIYRMDYSSDIDDWQWIVSDSSLSSKRTWHLGVLIPDSLTNCTEVQKKPQ